MKNIYYAIDSDSMGMGSNDQYPTKKDYKAYAEALQLELKRVYPDANIEIDVFLNESGGISTRMWDDDGESSYEDEIQHIDKYIAPKVLDKLVW